MKSQNDISNVPLIHYEDLCNWLGSTQCYDVSELHRLMLELINGDWTPEQARRDIIEYKD